MKTLELSESMKMGWAMLVRERDYLELLEARFIGSCLMELGGKREEGWRWDARSERFVKEDDVSGE